MKLQVIISNTSQVFPYLAEDADSKNVYIIFSGEKNWCDAMCVKVVHGNHWELFERRWADGSRLVDLPKGITITQEGITITQD